MSHSVFGYLQKKKKKGNRIFRKWSGADSSSVTNAGLCLWGVFIVTPAETDPSLFLRWLSENRGVLQFVLLGAVDG